MGTIFRRSIPLAKMAARGFATTPNISIGYLDGPIWHRVFGPVLSHPIMSAMQWEGLDGRLSTKFWGMLPRPVGREDNGFVTVRGEIHANPTESEADVAADRSDDDPLPPGFHHTIAMPAGELAPRPTPSEERVRADRSPEDPLPKHHHYH